MAKRTKNDNDAQQSTSTDKSETVSIGGQEYDMKVVAAHERTLQRMSLQVSDGRFQSAKEQIDLQNALRRMKVQSNPQVLQGKVKGKYLALRAEATYLSSLNPTELSDVVNCQKLVSAVRKAATSNDKAADETTSTDTSVEVSESAQQ